MIMVHKKFVTIRPRKQDPLASARSLPCLKFGWNPAMLLFIFGHLLSLKLHANKWRPVKAVGPKALFQSGKKAMVPSIQMDPNGGILCCKWNLSKWTPSLVKGRARLLRAALHLLHHHLPVFQILETVKSFWSLNFPRIFKIIYTHDS